jgi:hypothetical protein
MSFSFSWIVFQYPSDVYFEAVMVSMSIELEMFNYTAFYSIIGEF